MDSLLQMTKTGIKSNLAYYRLVHQRAVAAALVAEQEIAKFERLLQLKESDQPASQLLTEQRK